MRYCLVLAATTATALAAGAPENVLVVVNADSWASMWIANEYTAARDIPQNNVVHLRGLPSFERIGVEDFREKILKPALDAANKRGLAPHLDCIAYSADIPWAVDVTADISGRKFPKQITQPASLTGLTFLYQHVLAKNPTYLSLNANFYFRGISRIAPEKPWPEAERKRYEEALVSLQQAGSRADSAREKSPDAVLSEDDARLLRGVLDTMHALLASHPASTELHYNIACVHARLGDTASAIASLRTAMDKGWWDFQHASRDPDLRPLWDRAEFKALATAAKNVKFELVPTSGFRGSVGWAPGGAPVPVANGVRHLLSTMLACTSGRGLSVGEAVANLKRSIGADSSHPKGTVYFMQNGDVRSTTREWAFDRAVEKLRGIGLRAVVEKGVLPSGKSDVAGAVIGTADFDWPKSGSRILPGAIVEHLTSLGGIMSEDGGQTPLTEFLRHGAAGASGTVTEPYAIQAKFPSPFIHWHYAQGCTLAEAFYQSVAGPYQLLVVGEPLCAPWKKRISITLEDFEPGKPLHGKTTIKPAATSPDGLAVGTFEMFFDGTRVGAVRPGGGFTFDTSKADDGPHTLTIIASATDPIATTARVSFAVTTANADRTPVVTADASGDWPWDKPITFTANAPGARGVALVRHAMQLTAIEGESGTATLDPRALGQGPVSIQPVAIYPDGTQARAKPLHLRIVPPAPLPTRPAPPVELHPGLHVIPSGLPAVAVDKADGDWLEKSGVTRDGEFAVEAWFTADTTDVHQFQLLGPKQLRVFVDGQPLAWPRSEGWWFLPVHLSSGLHHLRIEGKAEGRPVLDARFGGPGTRKLAGPRFRHR